MRMHKYIKNCASLNSLYKIKCAMFFPIVNDYQKIFWMFKI